MKKPPAAQSGGGKSWATDTAGLGWNQHQITSLSAPPRRPARNALGNLGLDEPDHRQLLAAGDPVEIGRISVGIEQVIL
jgi:hypothetical protein